ncbi:MAG: hypothetical protein DRH93_13950 [Deltaproteobacteria bacterium]|nr:MAG: hypothetical protein DRH93_13950 [Deltaproteobacteria bacterium]
MDDGSHQQTGRVFNETCDDGNQNNTDGCTTKCRPCLQLGQMGNIEITTDTDLCPGEYHMDDYGDYGVIIIKASDITLNGHGAILIGEGRGVGIVNFRSNNVTIKNCTIKGYDVGLRIEDASNVTLQQNLICGNSQRNIELIDASDIHGYNPSLAATTTCMGLQGPSSGQIAKAGNISSQQAPTSSQASKSRAKKSVPRTAVKPFKDAQAFMSTSSTSSKPKSIRQSKSTKRPAGMHSLYIEAQKARWVSKSSKVVFNSDRVPRFGVAKSLSKGRLSNGDIAGKLLLTQPAWAKDGYIQGEFPAIKLGRKPHFKTIVTMLKGAHPSTLLSFDVLIRDGKRITVVTQQRFSGTKPIPLNVNLSRWKGKTIRLILRVRLLKGTKPAPAVWVNPSLRI